jgi:hypothetical protein
MDHQAKHLQGEEGKDQLKLEQAMLLHQPMLVHQPKQVLQGKLVHQPKLVQGEEPNLLEGATG